MDTENEIVILGVGVIVGWLITALSMVIVGAVFGIDEIILLVMVGISAGILFGFFLIVMMIVFFQEFKIVRRE